jgi:hypothetical protein
MPFGEYMKIRTLFRIALLASFCFLIELVKVENSHIWDDIVGAMIGISISCMLMLLAIKMFRSNKED